MRIPYGDVNWLNPDHPDYQKVHLPWKGIGEMAGISQKPSVNVCGFYLLDVRQNPPLAIFKNCQFQMTPHVNPFLKEMPEPWRAPAQAYEEIKKMGLSAEEEEACLYQKGPIRIAAMALDPGIGAPKPNTLIMDKDAFNSW